MTEIFLYRKVLDNYLAMMKAALPMRRMLN